MFALRGPGLKRLFFFWLWSFLLASAGYGLLWLVMPDHYVFGATYRMFVYHWQHPLGYIAIACFCYGIWATVFADRFYRQRFPGRTGLTLLLVALSVLCSSPFGGMLWEVHDMMAGYFPHGWAGRVVVQGAVWGLTYGWLIILTSIPYNVLGIIVCYFLTRKGAALYR